MRPFKSITFSDTEAKLMTRMFTRNVSHLTLLLFFALLVKSVAAQGVTILEGEDLKKVLPTSFYFEGLSGATQTRNAAAARIGDKRYVIIGMIDTAGYSTDVRAKYEGFFITDSKISLGGKDLATGAYGFGVTKDGQLNIFDLGGKLVLNVDVPKDSDLKAPRPLTLTKGADGIRMYRGKNYVVIAAK
jgi:hypothetical protein